MLIRKVNGNGASYLSQKYSFVCLSIKYLQRTLQNHNTIPHVRVSEPVYLRLFYPVVYTPNKVFATSDTKSVNSRYPPCPVNALFWHQESCLLPNHTDGVAAVDDERSRSRAVVVVPKKGLKL